MVIIVGGGITGAATAFYLSQQTPPPPITIIDAVGPAACSKAAAFLSESWGDGTKTEKLHRKSFALHQQLADELSLKSFQEIPVYHGDLEQWNSRTSSRTSPPSYAKDLFPAQPGRHALVDPKELIAALIGRSGATVEIGTVSSLQMSQSDLHLADGILLEDGQSKALEEEEPIVVAMGPWASRLEDWMAQTAKPVPIDGILSTSLLWNDFTPLDSSPSPLALFCEEDIRGCHLEIFQRVDNSLYVSGLGNSKPLKAAHFRGPNRPIPAREEPGRPDAALRSLQQAKLLHDDNPPDDIQACFRPMSPDGIPMAGKIVGNVYVATGGGQWGITWGPLVGQTIARQICGQEPPLSSALRPGRFDTLVQRTLMERRTKDAWDNNSRLESKSAI